MMHAYPRPVANLTETSLIRVTQLDASTPHDLCGEWR